MSKEQIQQYAPTLCEFERQQIYACHVMNLYDVSMVFVQELGFRIWFRVSIRVSIRINHMNVRVIEFTWQMISVQLRSEWLLPSITYYLMHISWHDKSVGLIYDPISNQ